MGFLEIEPAELVLSALKRAEERENLIMRIFNPGLRSIRGQIKLKIPTRQLWEVDLGESRLRELPIGPEGRVSIEVPAGRILSLELE